METMIGIASAVIAFSALVFSIYAFRRQQDREERHAVANVKPLLSMKSLNYKHHKAIKLMNHGLGPAIITHASFSKDDQSTDSIVELFKLEIEYWERFQNLPAGRAIPAQSEVVLLEQTKGHLLNQKYSEEKADELLSQWRQQKTGIEVLIEYRDILGNEIKPPLRDTLN